MAKILVVEDEVIVAWDIKETLEKLGHTVVDLIVSGSEALGSAFNENPDLVLMDIRLEGEMDGITAGDEIYHQLNIPVVYLTAHADEITLARATKTDPFGYIVKPFQSQSLQSTIKVALQRHQLEAAANLTQVSLVNTLNSIASGVIATDRQGLVTFINPIAATLTGWDSAAALGMEIDRVLRLTSVIDGTAVETPNRQAIWTKQSIELPERCWLVPNHRSPIPIAATATPMIDANGAVIGSTIVFQDHTQRLTAEMDLWEYNKDLELFQHTLISQLQAKTIEHQQAIACLEVLNLVLNNIHPDACEDEIFQIAIQQLGIAIGIDYCWVTFHDLQGTTARIACEYINQKRQIHPTSKIGQEIDLRLYPQFYNHLLEIGDWSDPDLDIIPKPYVNLLTPAAQMLICPITVDLPVADLDWNGSNGAANPRKKQIVGEVGIISTDQPPGISFQSHLITQTFSYAVQIFRQKYATSLISVIN